MAKVSKLYSSTDMFWSSPKFVSEGDLVIETRIVLPKNGWQTVPAFIKDGKLAPINPGLTGTFNLNPMCKVSEDVWLCQYGDNKPNKPNTGLLLSSDGKIVKWLDTPKTQFASINPFWSDGEYIGGKIWVREKGVLLVKDIVWKANGSLEGIYESLRPVNNSGIVGRSLGEFVTVEQNINCPGDFASPMTRGVRGFYTFGHMFIGGKVTTANTHSWIKNEMTGDVDFLQPEGVPFVDRFSASNCSEDGRFVWGLGFPVNIKVNSEAGEPLQTNLIWDRENGWLKMDEVFETDANFSKTIIDGEVAYTVSNNSLLKIENWVKSSE